jgi:two-component system phosphate regulon response regulator PhoB
MQKVVRHEDLVVDPVKHEVTIGTRSIELTMTEFKLLQFLLVNRGRAYTRNELLNAVLGRDSMVVDRNVDVHVATLRKKLGTHGNDILTIRGLGYKFRELHAPAS